MSAPPDNTIIVHIRPDDDNEPKIFEPSLRTSQTITEGQLTWSVYNFCTEPSKLWIQLQGFCLASSDPGTPAPSLPMLFGSPMSFGAELPPNKTTDPEPQIIKSPPIFPAPSGTRWQYSIWVLASDGVQDKLDPIVVLSGD